MSMRETRRRIGDDNTVTLPQGAQITKFVVEGGVRWIHVEADITAPKVTRKIRLTPWAGDTPLAAAPHGFSIYSDAKANPVPVPVMSKRIAGGFNVVHHAVAFTDRVADKLHEPRIWEALKVMRAEQEALHG